MAAYLLGSRKPLGLRRASSCNSTLRVRACKPARCELEHARVKNDVRGVPLLLCEFSSLFVCELSSLLTVKRHVLSYLVNVLTSTRTLCAWRLNGPGPNCGLGSPSAE